MQASDRAGGSRKEQRTGKSPAGSAADARRRMLQKRFPAPFLRKMEEQLPVWDGGRIREIAEAYGTRCIREIGEGGILDVLWNVAETFDAGLSADMKKIPIRQETIEICELFGIDPYYSLSWDAYLIVSESGETLASVIRGTGIPAAVIGHLEDSSARTLLCGTHTRYLDRPKPDSLLAFLAGKPCAW